MEQKETLNRILEAQLGASATSADAAEWEKLRAQARAMLDTLAHREEEAAAASQAALDATNAIFESEKAPDMPDAADTPVGESGEASAPDKDDAPASPEAERDAGDMPVACARYSPGGDVSLPAVPASVRSAPVPGAPQPAEAPVARPLLIPLFAAAVFIVWLLEILLPPLAHATVNELLGANALLYTLLLASALASFLQRGVFSKLTGCGLCFLCAFLRAWGLAKAKLGVLSVPFSLLAVFHETQFLLDLFLSVGPCVLMAVLALVSPLLFRKREQHRAYVASIAVSAGGFGLVYAVLGSFALSVVQPGKPLSAVASTILMCAVLASAAILLLWKAADAGSLRISSAPRLYLYFCMGFHAVVLAALIVLGVCDAFCAALLAASAFGVWRLLRGGRDGLYLFAGAAICLLIDAIISLLQSVDTGFAAGEALIGCAVFCAMLPALTLLLIRRMPAQQGEKPLRAGAAPSQDP